MKKALLSTLILIFSLQATPFLWWNDPGPELAEQPSEVMLDTAGDVKALILVSKFPEDTAVLYPPLYDSLIAPVIDSVDDSLYRWSITNFLYTASWKKLDDSPFSDYDILKI